MKKSLILILCGLLLGAAATWAVIEFIVPRWHRSAVDNTFWQVTSKLDQGGEAFAYVHAEEISRAVQDVLAGLKKNVDLMPAERQAQARQGLDMFALMFKNYGLDEISGLGFSSFAVKPGLHRVRIVLHHRPGRDQGLLWNIAGPSPRPLEEMGMLPDDTALAFVSDYNLGKLIEWLTRIAPMMAAQGGQGPAAPAPDQTMAMMKAGMQVAGIDYDRLIKSYGGRLGFLLTLDPEKRMQLPVGTKPLSLPEPAFALLVRVNDTYLFDTLKGKLTATGHNKFSEENGLKKIAFPRLPAPFPMEPVIVQKGEWLLAASRPALADGLLAARGARLADNADFKALAYKLPRRGNGFGYFSPLLGRLAAQALRENLASFPVPAALEKITRFLEQAKGMCNVWELSGEGFVYTINHGFDISSLPGLIEAFVEIAAEKAKAAAAKDAVEEQPKADE